MSKRDLALDLFRSYKTGFIKKTKVVEERTSKPGDPTLINEVIEDLITQRDWHLGIAEGTPDAGVQSLNFIGPQAPSWKRGLRTIKNERGPRDTYG